MKKLRRAGKKLKGLKGKISDAKAKAKSALGDLGLDPAIIDQLASGDLEAAKSSVVAGVKEKAHDLDSRADGVIGAIKGEPEESGKALRATGHGSLASTIDNVSAMGIDGPDQIKLLAVGGAIDQNLDALEEIAEGNLDAIASMSKPG